MCHLVEILQPLIPPHPWMGKYLYVMAIVMNAKIQRPLSSPQKHGHEQAISLVENSTRIPRNSHFQTLFSRNFFRIVSDTDWKNSSRPFLLIGYFPPINFARLSVFFSAKFSGIKGNLEFASNSCPQKSEFHSGTPNKGHKVGSIQEELEEFYEDTGNYGKLCCPWRERE